MTPEEKKLIAHMVKIVGEIMPANPDFNKLMDLANKAGMDEYMETSVEYAKKMPVSHDDNPCGPIRVTKEALTGAPKDMFSTMLRSVKGLGMECVVEIDSEIDRMLDAAYTTLRPVDITGVRVSVKRPAVGRDDVRVYELDIANLEIKKKKEEKTDDNQ